MTNKAKAEFYKNEYMAQFRINRNLKSEIEKLKAEVEHQKAIAEAMLDSLHKLGEDYRRALEEEHQHIREAKVEAVKEVGKRIMDSGYDGIVSATDVLDIVVDYVRECEEDE